MRAILCFFLLCAWAWPQLEITSTTSSNGSLQLAWTGGTAPWRIEARSDGGTNWNMVGSAAAPSATIPISMDVQHLRVVSAPVVSPSARYRVSFLAFWSGGTHPGNFPRGAHFTDFEAVTHNSEVTFWEVGQLASPGIERVAELGATSVWKTEIAEAVAAGTGDQTFALVQPGSPSFINTPGLISAEFDVNASHPLVTFASMIAPSPDWFVGVSGFNLLADGDWVDDVTLRANVYDSGTETGSEFSLFNPAEDPHKPIAIEPVINALAPFGQFRFERIDGP